MKINLVVLLLVICLPIAVGIFAWARQQRRLPPPSINPYTGWGPDNSEALLELKEFQEVVDVTIKYLDPGNRKQLGEAYQTESKARLPEKE